MATVFFHNEEQQRLAIETRDTIAARTKGTIVTQILPVSEFYLAEEFSAMYPDTTDFINSTAAARVNAYLAGYGTIGSLEAEVNRLGLSQEGRKKLLDRVRALHR